MTYTRQDYLKKACSHRQYYSQFVTKDIIDTVRGTIGALVLNSKDPHFNDISLAAFDAIAVLTGNSNPLSDGVCIAKEAARQIKEEARQGKDL